MARKKQPPRLGTDDQGNYYVYYNANGRSQRKSLRTDNLLHAEARFAGWLEAHNKDQVVDADPKIADCLGWWFEQWIEGRMLSEARYPSVIGNLKAYFGKMRVSKVTKLDSQEYARLRRKGQIGTSAAAESTIRRELQSLRACLNFMIKKVEPRERRITQDIVPYVELPNASPPRNRVLTADELDRLYEHCHNLVQNGAGMKPTNRLAKIGRFVVLAMETAQRKSAILELKWQQVNLDRNMIHFLPEGKLQTTKRRPPLPISKKLRPVLERAKAEAVNDYVCDNPADIHYQLKCISDELNVPDLSAHVFRHTWATRAVEDGVDITKVAAFLGDSVKTVEKNYIHLSPGYLSDVIDR